MDAEMRAATAIVAVSVDDRERQRMMVERVREEYGVELDYILLSRGRPVPHPTTLVIDRSGVVRWRFTEVDYRVRPEPGDIVAALRELH
jgi:peroxiredoxin